MTLWLLRHARVHVAPGLCYGVTDLTADPEHTEHVAQAIAAVLPTGVRLRVSALQRAQALAHALRRLRPDLCPGMGEGVTDARLNEMDFGHWEMQPWDAIPRAAWDAWLADFAHHRFGGRESTAQFIHRVAQALQAERERGATQAVWITHAGVIRAVQYILEHGYATIRDASQWPTRAPEPGGWQCVSWPEPWATHPAALP